jgi:cobalt-zinc-cadmium efflux system outer membrane protein
LSHAAPVAVAIDFDEALGLVDLHPRAQGAAGAVDEKKALDAQISRFVHNPQLTVQPGYRLAPRDSRQPEFVVELLQPWNLGGYADARRETVHLEEAVAEAGARATRLSLRLAVAESWIVTWAAERALEDAERQGTIAAELARLVARAADLGAATKADAADADAYAAEVALARLDAEGELFVRGVALARALGGSDPRPRRTKGTLPTPPVPARDHLDQMLAVVARAPEIVRLEMSARAERARAVEERAARGTSAAVGGLLQRDAPGGLVLSASLRLSPAIFDAGERERASSAASARRMEGDAATARVDASASLVESFHEVEHAQESLQHARERFLPAARSAADLRRRLYEAGRGTLPEVLFAERQALSASARARQAEAGLAWARVKLWLLVAPLAILTDERKQ